VWDFVSWLLKDPEHIRRGIERMIDRECAGMKGKPEQEENMWAEKLAQVDRKRSRYQEMAAEGLLTFEELRAKLTELQKSREATERELENLRSRKERLEELEKDRDALLESLVTMIPASLDTLSGLERNKVYRMLRLIVMPASEGYEVSGALCTTGPSCPL
jgi:multidrug resistance efflux pump